MVTKTRFEKSLMSLVQGSARSGGLIERKTPLHRLNQNPSTYLRPQKKVNSRPCMSNSDTGILHKSESI